MSWYRHLLWPFAILYGMGVGFRNLLFDLGILPSKQFDVPVVCVGNLETGGTGKSPLVSYIVRMLLQKGKNVAVISRGYGRRTSGFRMVEEESRAVDVGDEPLQLKLRYPKAVVAVCEKRVEGIEKLLQLNPKPDFVVMDDGFQHRWVKPSFSILTTSAALPYYQNWLLPVGTLREPIRSAVRSDVRVMTSVSPNTPNSIFEDDVFATASYLEDEIQILGDTKALEPDDIIVGFCGIANADRFEMALEDNFDLKAFVTYSDHHNYTESDLRSLRKKIDSFGGSVQAVVTTEKDAVRLVNTPLLNELGNIPVYYLPIDVEFLFDMAADFETMILEHGEHA